MMEPEKKKEIGIITYCAVKEWGKKKKNKQTHTTVPAPMRSQL